MTNLIKLPHQSKATKKLVHLAARDLLSDHYSALPEVLRDPETAAQIDRYIANHGLERLLSANRPYTVPAVPDLERFPHILSSISEDFLEILNSILADPLSYRKALTTLKRDFDGTQYDPQMLMSIFYQVEELRSLLHFAHLSAAVER